MCGRYAAGLSAEEIAAEFDLDVDLSDEPTRSVLKNPQEPPAGSPDYNMSPTKQAHVVVERSARQDPQGPTQRQLRLMTWGLVPGSSADPSVGVRMINARAQTLLEKPVFARAATTRRLLVPADGWYEWQASPVALDAKGKPRKQPFFVRRRDQRPMAFAGIYALWRDRSRAAEDPQAWLASFSIITTAAEPGLDRLHERQPVVLERQHWADWLSPQITEPQQIRAVLQAQPEGRFEAWPVGRAVSNSRSSGAHLLQPAHPSELDGVLDPATGEVLGPLN